jgi:chromosome segregation protein
MRIDKIELIGFKSFADKTTFHFHPGITCIVGPNGCGKSNVVDAFRWVLGEQSAKSLRGDKMEEVIFNGSVSKKPKGMAEVTLVVSGLDGTVKSQEGDNGEGVSDVAFISRRLYRSGESEYILNKNQSRLKDVKDLFLDTGLEVKSYSVLEQDRITDILHAKPLDRRILIEEIAGVMKYNVRKREAQAKLESSRANLQRINDIIVEVKRQINFLDRLAKKAERYKKLSSEIRSIELKIAKRDYRALKDSSENIIADYNKVREQESQKKAELATIENKTSTKRLKLLEKEKSLQHVQEEFQRLEKEIAGLEKLIAVAKTERDNSSEYLLKLYQQGEEFNTKRADLLIKQQEAHETEVELSNEIETQKELLSEKSDYLRSLEEELNEDRETLEDRRKDLFRMSEELSSIKNDHSKLQSSLEGLNQRETLSKRDVENLNTVIAETEAALQDLQTRLLEKNNELMLLNEQKVTFDGELSASKGNHENLRENLLKLKEDVASDIARIASLQEVVFDESTKELLSEDVQFNLLASISDIIEVEDAYERAIESLLSEKVNSFILSSYDDIEIAVSAVKEKRLGRTVFLPNSPLPYEEHREVPDGSLGNALRFIKVKEEFSQIVKSLFDNTFIVGDLRTALDLAASGHKATFVTLDGEVLETTGAVIAGEVKGVFKRKREIRELEAAMQGKKTQLHDVQTALDSLQQLIIKRESEIKNIETAIVEREKEVSVLKLTVEKSREEKERRSRKLAYLTLELEQMGHEKRSIEKLLDEKEAELQTMNSKKEELENQSSTLQETISQKRLHIEAYRGEVTDLKLYMTSLKERLDSIRKERETVLKEITDNNQKRGFLSEEITSIKSRILQRDEEVEENENKIRSLVSAANELGADISERKEVMETENQELLKTEDDMKHLRKHIESISQSVAELDIRRTEHKMKMENLSDQISQNYGLDIAVADVEQLTSEDESRLVELKEKVEALGPVNLGTLEEYEELRIRYDFLKTQQDDLIKSIAELEEAIVRINVTTRRKLREAFDLLKAKFSEVFVTLFGGGRAELVMTDEHNILETGIDIIAQPPGKKLQNINLLSGGEKTLTVLSLLFASFLIKPSPLCIFDEADSALDESNTERFAQMVQELAKNIQFIVVTHNRSTMSAADYIYGITMEEAGVSKVISMQLAEA